MHVQSKMVNAKLAGEACTVDEALHEAVQRGGPEIAEQAAVFLEEADSKAADSQARPTQHYPSGRL